MTKTFFALLMIVSLSASAQKNLKFSVGPELAAVTGNLNSAYSLAIGGTAQLDVKIDKDAAITFNTGIIDFIGKKITGTSLKYQSQIFIPLLVGVKYYFIPKVYGSAQLGASFATGNGSKGSTFTYAPGIGYKIDEKIDLLLKYTGLSNNGGTFGIRLGFSLN